MTTIEQYEELKSKTQSAFHTVKKKNDMVSINKVIGPIVDDFFKEHGLLNRTHRIIIKDEGDVWLDVDYMFKLN